MTGIKKYIGNKEFYKMTFLVAVPIMIQNFITNFVSLLDNIMVGSLGTEQMSGVSIVNQLMFIFNLAIFGALSGAGIFTAQFHGKNDNEGIRYTLRYKLGISALLFAVGIVVFIAFDEPLINLFLHESDGAGDIALTLSFAKDYLKVMLLGVLPFCITQIFSSTLRETGETIAPMVAGFIAVLTNCAFNWVLIFGKLGFPALGVQGAAIATIISRYVECVVIIVFILRNKHRFSYFKGAFKSFSIPKNVFKDITFKGMPLLFNEFFWSLGMSLLSVAYSLHGIPVVAAYSICSTVMNLANIAFISLGNSIGIIVGKQLGANKFDEAVDTVRKLIAFSAVLSIIIGAVVYKIGDVIPLIYKISDESKSLATFFIQISALFLFVHAFANASYFTVRSGGKTFITFLMDSVFVMCINVPVAFALYYVFALPIRTVFPIVLSLDIIKVVVGLILVHKKVWLNNIVED